MINLNTTLVSVQGRLSTKVAKHGGNLNTTLVSVQVIPLKLFFTHLKI